eukprot:TRINITY_DN13619_c2_g1_i1.p1 TRINITY_DN13619_c2_g1~~TRINITY_DN13619_c2_g1_i1.p1  ORF type:complete len:192 (+),score=37.90 TRINITY_DN13619_c2_g1_i1:50-625(+)
MGLSFCCPPKGDADDGELPLVPPVKVKIGKRGAHVKVATDVSSMTITGSGTALADCVIEQDAAYWEVRVLEVGQDNLARVGISFDVGGQRLDSHIGDGQSSWAIGGDLVGGPLVKNDLIGIAFGQGDIPNLRFFRNGEAIYDAEVLRVRGEAHPAVSVGEGDELMWVFEPGAFAKTPPGRHTEVRPPRKMI